MNLDDFSKIPPNVSLDPTDWANQPIHELVRIMQYYVLQDPLHLNFSAEFLRLFNIMTNIDEEILSPDFEAQLQQTNGMYTDLKKMRIMLIRIQLRVVLRKKVIIEVECPDNPNFK